MIGYAKFYIIYPLIVRVLKAVVIKNLAKSSSFSSKWSTKLVLQEEKVGDLVIRIKRDVLDACSKLDAKKNFLKGITTDESMIIHVSEFHIL